MAQGSGNAWHAMAATQACRALGVDGQTGLDPAQAARLLDEIGPNRLPRPRPRPPWRVFLSQFGSVLTLVLLAAGVLAGVIGDTIDMVVIVIVVLFNAVLGFYQEWRAERILDALKAMLAPTARVRRGGQIVEIAAEQVVPGDVVDLHAGDRVPADGRLLATHGLEIDESCLTGESVVVAKDQDAHLDADTALGDRVTFAFMNTVVTRGHGLMVVTATGAATEMGRLAHLLTSAPDGATPLQKRLDGLGRRLAAIAGLVVAVILVAGLARGQDWAESILTAIALAVAAIPEGLPAVVTVTLAIGMYRMARRGAIVKRLAAVETLGSTSVICSDKTGTLTLNQMTVRALWSGGRSFTVSGDGYGGAGAIIAADQGGSPDWGAILAPAALCNDARLSADGALIGDPTEGALLALARKAGGGPSWPRLAEAPFDSAARIMVTLHQGPQGPVLLVKGAPEAVLARCTHMIDADGAVVALDDGRRAQVAAAGAGLGEQALRVLALAGVPVAGVPEDLPAAAQGLTLTALAGLMDPPRPEAREAIAACARAGIAVKMITGDHRVTAAAIARLLGLDGAVVTGAELDAMDDAALAARVAEIAVFARVSPEHKVRIVAALQAGGAVTAMTGDGVNDAAALRRADIGIAMGRTGSDVTREAAAMVLTDDNFATIVGAVAEGRTITDNIVKFVRFQLSTNIGALLTVLAAPLVGLASPFNAIQILWVNIIMDGPPAMALSFDPPRAGLMHRPPGPAGGAILPLARLARLAAYGLTMMVGTLAVLWWGQTHGAPERAQTLAFTTFVLFQFFNIFNARVGTESAFGRHMFVNAKLWVSLGGVVALQALAVHWPPAQAVFHTQPLSAADWGLALAVAASVLLLDEARKLAGRLARALAGRG